MLRIKKNEEINESMVEDDEIRQHESCTILELCVGDVLSRHFPREEKHILTQRRRISWSFFGLQATELASIISRLPFSFDFVKTE